MMPTRRTATLAACGLLMALAGCVSLKRTPEARFFVLRSLAEPPAAPAPATEREIVGVSAVRLPGHLERAQLVTWQAPGELRVDEFLRWAEPLEEGLTRTLTENLAKLLPHDRVIRRPWAGGTPLRCRVVVEIERFGLQRSGVVQLDGRWALLPGRGERPLAMRAFALERSPSASDNEGAVDAGTGVHAMSELVADLSHEIAAGIRTLPPAEPEKASDAAASQ